MSSLAERRRPHEEPHVRTTEQQILDALLRIEELQRNPSPNVEITGIDNTPLFKTPAKDTKAAEKPKGRFGRK